MKKFLFIMQTAPYNGIQLQEKLDLILTAAAFDQEVALLFIDDGIFQLKKGQQAEKHGLKDTASIFNALEIYDINTLYMETESLLERGLKVSDLSLAITEIKREEVGRLIGEYDILG